MITLAELNLHQLTPSPEQEKNLSILLERMNVIRKAYGRPMLVTSGLRSIGDQTRIDHSQGRKARLKSNHLAGAACDIWDRDRTLWNWCIDNMKLLEQVGLWLEDKSRTPSWVHFQIYPPASGNRIFLP